MTFRLCNGFFFWDVRFGFGLRKEERRKGSRRRKGSTGRNHMTLTVFHKSKSYLIGLTIFWISSEFISLLTSV